jgi:hypothetical protein
MALVRPIADIANFGAPAWTTAPLFEKVNSVERDDSTFIIGGEPNATDPQVSFLLGDLQIPYGSSGRIEVTVAMRWAVFLLEQTPITVRIGLGNAVDLGLDNPPLLFERSLVGTDIFNTGDDTLSEFQEFKVVFDYEDFSGNADAFGVYIEMTLDLSTQDSIFPEISWIEVLSCVPAVLVETCSLGSLTAGDIITDARDHHTSFEPRRHPDRVLLRMLSSYQKQILAKIAQTNPALCASNLFVALPLEDFAAGVTLPSFTYLLPNPTLITTNNEIREPIDLLNATFQSDFEAPRKFAYLQGQRLFLGRRSENYDAYDRLRLQLVLTPRDLVTLNDPLALPDYGEDAYVEHLTLKMAMRSTPPLTSFASNSAEVDFLASVGQQKGAEVSQTRDVFPGGW